MQITREDLNPCTVQLTIVCEGDSVEYGFQRAYKDLAKRVRIPGFRPGQAPKAMIENLISKEALYESAAEHIVRDGYRHAIESEKLEPHTAPSVELKSLDKDKSACEFVVKVPLAPKLELCDYKNLSAEIPVVEVREEEVERQIDELRKRRSTHEKITDRGAQEGDACVVHLRAENGSEDGKTFLLMAGQTFPTLDKALIGMKVEEMKSVRLEFPANFQEKDWAGKEMNAHVTLRSLSAVKLPELDVAFAQAYKTESVDDLKSRIREGIEGAKKAMADDYVAEQLLEALLKQSEVHVPDTMWEQVANRRVGEMAEEQRKKNVSMEEYAKEQGMTVEQLFQAIRNEAKMHVQRAVVIQEIFRKEEMQLSNEDLNRELHSMAREFGISAEDLVAQLKKNNALDELHFRAVNRKVADFLREHANLTEVRLDE